MSIVEVLSGIWRLLDRGQRRQLAAMQALSLIMALSTVGGVAAVMPFFTVLADPRALSAHSAVHSFYERTGFSTESRFIIALGIFFAAGVVVSNVINLLGSLIIDHFSFRVGDTLHAALFNEYLHRGLGFHLQTNSATLTSNVLHETGRVAAGILRHSLILITSVVTALSIVASIVVLNPPIALVAIVGLGASYTAVYAIARSRLRRNGERESEDVAERTRIVSECFGAIKELILLQAQPLFVARFAQRCRSISRTHFSNLATAQSPRHVLECATACVLVGIAIYSRVGGEAVGPLIAQLSFIGLAVYRLLPVLQQVFIAIVRIRLDTPAFERIQSDLERSRPAPAMQLSTCSQPSWHGRPARDIRMMDVSFSHSRFGTLTVAKATLRIASGSIVGIIGPNGSGKTTIIDLLSGLLIPQSGRVEIDGILLDDDNRRVWQSTIAYVPQSIFLCDSTLAENIALGVPPAEIDRERVRTVVQLAQLEQCVAKLPNGLDERLGERGVRLSGGYRQRLGIARALYRRASLLIMDEATSALDTAAESDITDTLAAQRKNFTIVIVAHRMSALRHCDVIYEVAHGRILPSRERALTLFHDDQEVIAHRPHQRQPR